MLENSEKQYFDLLLKFCLKIDRALFISCDRITADVGERIAKYAKSIGVPEVHLFWQDIRKEAEILKTVPLSELAKHPAFDYSEWNEYAKRNAAFLILRTEVPGVFDGVDEKKTVEAAKLKRISQEYYKKVQLSYEISWTIAVVPNEIWAKDLYPDALNPYEKFYETVFRTCMISDGEDIVEKWQTQLRKNSALAHRLNGLKIKELHYTAPNGTDLFVKLRPQAVWLGADKGGMVVNMPTYEVFTYPDAFGVNGIVKSTRPLFYNGTKIDGFAIRFENGKAVHAHAECGEDALNYLITCASGSDSLGEVALVDCRSPVALQNKTFGVTLLDENAACHFAFGNAYPATFADYATTKPEDLATNGFNVSMIHVDFMIGYDELTVTAETENGSVVIMENGSVVIMENGKIVI